MSANGDKRPSEATKIQEEIGGLTEQKEHLKAKLKQDKTLTANDRAEIETEIAALRKKLHELATKQQEDETKASRIKRYPLESSSSRKIESLWTPDRHLPKLIQL